MYTTSLLTIFLTLLSSTPNTVADPIDTLCGQYQTASTSVFTLNNNLWGESAGSGSQCTYLDYDSGNTISWQTEWTWSGGSSNVKSYSNAGINIGATQLSSITSMPSTWSWSYTGNSLVGDVSYDAFVSSVPSTTAAHDFEVMVWLAQLGGAQPIGYGTPIASPTINGITWNLYEGTNGWTVFSFVATSQVNDFSGDVNAFFTYLIDNQGMPAGYYLQTLQAGTEAFTGSDAWFTVSPYTLSVNT
ncbi:glycoside hydrolase family 12 protein [Lipomyces tetrasporus]|uniref:Glycoside hydrolase family 12 protein n=1 Tax=Lipomyces tetrasporus TaxID=54092 RepID=A0AAD7VSJ2_9ASCO|nr:glycoside hydrolase family 12 protein [Lipomyces tetrasporus]KAJ8100151.1 glycoside hydrolase family 12 protein [Lipomyces tetrasporus]